MNYLDTNASIIDKIKAIKYYSLPMDVMIGLTFDSVIESNSAITFKGSYNSENGIEEFALKLDHDQQCCETVYIDEMSGELEWLVNQPILKAERVTSFDNRKESTHEEESFTWTFFKIATIKGMVDVKFYGESNGFYSEDADLTIEYITKKK